jgi:hypothetical protein
MTGQRSMTDMFVSASKLLTSDRPGDALSL